MNENRQIPFVVAIPAADWLLWKAVKWWMIVFSAAFWCDFDWRHVFSAENFMVISVGSVSAIWFGCMLRRHHVIGRTIHAVEVVIRSVRWIVAGRV